MLEKLSEVHKDAARVYIAAPESERKPVSLPSYY